MMVLAQQSNPEPLGSKPCGVRSVTNLEGVPDGYRAMNDSEAINI
jgi:hypothetical protein